jgi:hypothetical protein
LISILHIKFSKSKARDFKRILRECRILKGFTDNLDNTYELKLTTDLFEQWELFALVHHYITNWKSSRVYFKGKLIYPYNNKIFYLLQDLHFCIRSYNQAIDYCNCDWGCRMITDIRFKDRQIKKTLLTKMWYEFGHFKGSEKFIIEKDKILIVILNEAENKCIDSCPYFSMERLQNSINNLPDELDLTNKDTWLIEYEIDYTTGILQHIPVRVLPVEIFEADQDQKARILKKQLRIIGLPWLYKEIIGQELN